MTTSTNQSPMERKSYPLIFPSADPHDGLAVPCSNRSVSGTTSQAPQGFSHAVATIDHLPTGDFGILRHALTYIDTQARRHTALEGMPTDGISIPARLTGITRLLPFRSVILRPAIIHDHYCYQALSLPPGPGRRKLRLSGDLLFYEMARFVRPEAPAKNWIIFRSVRLGALAGAKANQLPSYTHDYPAFLKALNIQLPPK